jgi:hypothetical protein
VFTFHLSKQVGSGVGIDGAFRDAAALRELSAAPQGGQGAFRTGRFPLERKADFEPADLPISSNVLEYVDELDHILAQFSRLVKPGSALTSARG